MGFLESVSGWRTRWFYVKDSPNSSGEPLVNLEARVAQHSSWRNQLTAEEMTQTDEYMTQIAELKQRGLTGMQLTGIFFKCRVQPLQNRAEPMWVYQGAEDTNRLRKDELSNNELEAFLRNIIKTSCLESDLTGQPFWLPTHRGGGGET